jgi:hypothetical protein
MAMSSVQNQLMGLNNLRLIVFGLKIPFGEFFKLDPFKWSFDVPQRTKIASNLSWGQIIS